MRSQLTRVVIRKLLANEPIAHRGCLRRPLSSRACALQQNNALRLSGPQRRTFFNLFPKAKKEVREADYDPGLEKMMEYAKMKRLGARLPPTQDVVKALKTFFHRRSESKRPIEDEQMQYILPSFKYIQEQGSLEALGTQKLKEMLSVLSQAPDQPSQAHHQLGTAVFYELKDRDAVNESDILRYISCLVQSGEATVAREFVATQELSPVLAGDCWIKIAEGFAREDNEKELLKSLEIGSSSVVSHSLHHIVTTYYARRDNTKSCKTWFDRTMQVPQSSAKTNLQAAYQTHVLYETVLQLCLRKGDMDWGQSVIRTIMTTSPSKKLWDVVFVWAAGTGKGVDEIDRMIGVMEKSNQGIANKDEWRLPDIDTINKLVEFAISRNDPYMAERFIDVGKKRNIQPNAKTLVLQMDYRLSVNDVDGALIAYKHLQTYDLSNEQDVPAANRLLRAMCTTGRHDFESIMNVAADLSDRQARFEPGTVSALSGLHLRRGELHDVVDLLNTHAFHYSISERASIRDSFISYCLDPSTTTASAWDAYTILRQVFDETPRELRTKIMNEFLRRERPDMAVHIFNHMRTHSRADTAPTVDTYIACFRGIAELQDMESLEVVHNQLKLDLSIEPETTLLNALILAFTKCRSPRRALGFWDDIVASREGPTINSIHLAFRACERAAWGDRRAKEIWQRLVRAGMEFDNALWASYVGGLAGNGEVNSTIELLEEVQQKGEVQIDAFIIGSLYNAAPGSTKKDIVADWAKERYPQAWRELEGLGYKETLEELKGFAIEREIEP